MSGMFEPEAQRFTGNDGYKAAISTAISARRTADTLDRIELILIQVYRAKPPRWWHFGKRP